MNLGGIPLLAEQVSAKIKRGELLNDLGKKYTVILFSDGFRAIATAIVVFCGFSGSAFAALDLSVGGTLRSYPLSGLVEINAGPNYLLWGTHAGDSAWYGYLRPRVDGATAGTYNSLGAGLEFFPLSFLGARAGGEGIQNDSDYKNYDCVTYTCRGRFYRTYVEGEVSLGVGPFFAQGRWRRERWTEPGAPAPPFIEPTSSLSLAGIGDSQTVYRALVGVKLNPIWSIAAGVEYVESDSQHGVSRLPFALLRYSSGALSAGAGGGVFSSTMKPSDFSAIGYLRWDIRPSLALK